MALCANCRIGLVYKPLRSAPFPSQLYLRDTHQHTAHSPESPPDDTMRYVVRGNDCVYGKVRYCSLPPITTFANTLATVQSAETKDVAAVSKTAAAEVQAVDGRETLCCKSHLGVIHIAYSF